MWPVCCFIALHYTMCIAGNNRKHEPVAGTSSPCSPIGVAFNFQPGLILTAVAIDTPGTSSSNAHFGLFAHDLQSQGFQIVLIQGAQGLQSKYVRTPCFSNLRWFVGTPPRHIEHFGEMLQVSGICEEHKEKTSGEVSVSSSAIYSDIGVPCYTFRVDRILAKLKNSND